MEVTGPVEPGPIVVVSHIDDQRVPLPVPSRLPHPEAQCFRKLPPIRPDPAKGMAVFVRDDRQFRRLEDLKRVRQVGNAWDTGQVTITQRVSGHPILVIVRLPGRCPRLVRDLQPLHDTLPPRHSLLSIVVLKIPGGRREGLPDTTQVRCAVRCTWELTPSKSESAPCIRPLPQHPPERPGPSPNAHTSSSSSSRRSSPLSFTPPGAQRCRLNSESRRRHGADSPSNFAGLTFTIRSSSRFENPRSFISLTQAASSSRLPYSRSPGSRTHQ